MTGPKRVKYRIREAQTQQTPYMVVLGDKEVEDGIVAVRHRRQGDLGTMKPEALLAKLQTEIATKESI
jgi:threonyl-tRNA synthetase